MQDIGRLFEKIEGFSEKHREGYLKSLVGRAATLPDRMKNLSNSIKEGVKEANAFMAELDAIHKLIDSSFDECEKIRAEFKANGAVLDEESLKVGAIRYLDLVEYMRKLSEKASRFKKKGEDLSSKLAEQSAESNLLGEESKEINTKIIVLLEAMYNDEKNPVYVWLAVHLSNSNDAFQLIPDWCQDYFKSCARKVLMDMAGPSTSINVAEAFGFSRPGWNAFVTAKTSLDHCGTASLIEIIASTGVSKSKAISTMGELTKLEERSLQRIMQKTKGWRSKIGDMTLTADRSMTQPIDTLGHDQT